VGPRKDDDGVGSDDMVSSLSFTFTSYHFSLVY
jgi:hypothetical protein